MKKMTRLGLGLLVLSLLAFGAAACGDDDDDSGGSGDETSASSGGDGLAQAEEIVTQAQTPEGTGPFPFPEESFDAGTGSAMVISTGDTGCPTCQFNADRTVDVFKQIGWDVGPHRDGEFQPAVIGGFIQEAIQDKLDAIVIITHNVSQNLQDVQAAKDAGIAVSCVNCDISDEVEALGITDSSIDFTAEGELMGWWVINRSEGQGNIVVTDEPSRDPVIHRTEGTTRILEENCPDCEVQVEPIPVTSVAKPGPPEWRSILSGNPDMTDAVGYFDGIAIAMATTAESAGSDVKISGYDTDEAAVEMLKSGDTFVGDIAIPYEYQDWSAVDQVLREHAGLQPWVSNDMPTRLITKDNVDTFDGNFAPPDDWKQRFLNLWGKG